MVKGNTMNWSEAEIHSTDKNNKQPRMNQTEIGLLPEDWDVKFIKDVSDIVVGGDVNFSKFSNVQDLKYRYPIFSNTVSNRGLYGYSSSYKVDANSITVIGRGVGIGKSFSRNGKYTAIGRLIVLDLSSNLLNNVFLSNYINSYLEIYDESGGIPQLTGISLGRYQVPLPPLPEQEAIAEALSDADAWIESLEQLIAKKRLIKQGAMQELLTPKEDWEVKKLGEVADFFKGKGLPKSELSDSGGFKCIHYGELFTKYKELVGQIHSKTNYNDNTILSKTNDVLMPTSDVTPRGLATASCIKEEGVILGGDILIVRFKSIIDGLFFSYFITNNKEEVLKYVSGSTVYHLYGSELSNLNFSFPKSLTEQIRIARILSDMDAELEALEGKLGKARKVKQGMMQELLTGRVRLV